MHALVFSIAASTVSILGVLTSCVVIFILRSSYHAKQNLILTILLVVCLSENFAFILLWGNTFIFTDPKLQRTISRLMFIICTGIYQMFVFSLVAMTTDRFVAFFRPFRYRKIVTRTRVLTFFGVAVTLTVVIRIPFLVSWSISLSSLFKIDIIMETLFLLPQPFVYILMYKKWKTKVKSYKRIDLESRKHRQSEHRIFMFLTVILFVTCLGQILSDAFHVVDELSQSNSIILGYVSNALWIFIIFITPLCHVFVKPKVRKEMNRFRKSWSSNNSHMSSTRSSKTFEMGRTMKPSVIFHNSHYTDQKNAQHLTTAIEQSAGDKTPKLRNSEINATIV